MKVWLHLQHYTYLLSDLVCVCVCVCVWGGGGGGGGIIFLLSTKGKSSVSLKVPHQSIFAWTIIPRADQNFQKIMVRRTNFPGILVPWTKISVTCPRSAHAYYSRTTSHVLPMPLMQLSEHGCQFSWERKLAAQREWLALHQVLVYFSP